MISSTLKNGRPLHRMQHPSYHCSLKRLEYARQLIAYSQWIFRLIAHVELTNDELDLLYLNRSIGIIISEYLGVVNKWKRLRYIPRCKSK